MDKNLSDQLRCLEEGRGYREAHPESTLSDALQESRQRWPEAHETIYRAFFLTGWSDDLQGRQEEGQLERCGARNGRYVQQERRKNGRQRP
jgi:ribosomal protein L34